jgi:proline iminopeptidase
VKPRALLLHGGPGVPDYLEPLAAELEPLFECDRYQQQSHADVPAFVEEALTNLRARSWIVGHSWGGRLALEVAAAAPERALGLVLIGSVGAVGDGGWRDAGPRLTSRLTDEERRQLASVAPGDELRVIWPAYFADRELAPPYPDWVVDTETVDAIYAWVQERAPRNELADALRSFEPPVLLLHGAFTTSRSRQSRRPRNCSRTPTCTCSRGSAISPGSSDPGSFTTRLSISSPPVRRRGDMNFSKEGP